MPYRRIARRRRFPIRSYRKKRSTLYSRKVYKKFKPIYSRRKVYRKKKFSFRQ